MRSAPSISRVAIVPGWSGGEIPEGYLAADGDAVILSDPLAQRLWRVDAQGKITEVARGLRFPGGVAIGSTSLYVAERDAGRIAVLSRPAER